MVLDRLFVKGFESKCTWRYTAIEIIDFSHLTMDIYYIFSWKPFLTKIRYTNQIISSQHSNWWGKKSPEIGRHPKELRWDNFNSFRNEDGWVINAGVQEFHYANESSSLSTLLLYGVVSVECSFFCWWWWSWQEYPSILKMASFFRSTTKIPNP